MDTLKYEPDAIGTVVVANEPPVSYAFPRAALTLGGDVVPVHTEWYDQPPHPSHGTVIRKPSDDA